jgi:hypothetical protein
MTPHQQHLAEQVSKETDSGKLKHLIAELCLAFDSEREENRQSRTGCLKDCKEHEQKPDSGRVIITSLEEPSTCVSFAI